MFLSQLLLNAALLQPLVCRSTSNALVRRLSSRRGSFPVRVVESSFLPQSASFGGAYAAATVTFPNCNDLSATAAAKTALDKIQSRKPLRHATFLLLYTSMPRTQAHAALQYVSSELNGAVLAGCTTSRWQPEGEILEAGGGGSDVAVPHHLTIAAAFLPHLQAHAFHTTHDGMPPVPSIPDLITTHPPHFLVITHPTDHRSTGQGYHLLCRLENIFPGSAIVGTVADWVRDEGRPPRPSLTPDSHATFITSTPTRPPGQPPDGPPSIGSNVINALTPGDPRQGRRRPGRRRSASSVRHDPLEQDPDLDSLWGAGASYLFQGTATHNTGTVGIMLTPTKPEARLQPQAAATLVRMMLGGERFGGDTLETPRFVYAAPVRAQLLPSFPQWAGGGLPRPAPENWTPAVVTPSGLQGNISKHSVRQNDQELPILALPRLVLWPRQRVRLTVVEPRHLLLLRCCSEQGGALGVAHEGVGTTAYVAAVQEQPGGGVTVDLIGGRRFEYLPGNPRVHTQRAARVLPATFGLTVVTVSYVEDAEPQGEEAARVVDAAQEACRLLLRGFHEAGLLKAPAGELQALPRAGQRFAAALHLKAVAGGVAVGRAIAEEGAGADVRQQEAGVGAADVVGRSGGGSRGGGGGLQGGRPVVRGGGDMQSDIRQQALQRLDLATAQQVSLWLGGVLGACVGCPTSRSWLRHRGALSRLEQQVQVLKKYECRSDAVAALAAQHYDHPLKLLLCLY